MMQDIISQIWQVNFSYVHSNERMSGTNTIEDLTMTYHFTLVKILLTIGQYSLLHRKPLFVVSAGDTHKVSLPFITQRISFYLCAHTFLIKYTKPVFISNFEQFLASRCRVGYVQLHQSSQYTYIYSETLYIQPEITIHHASTDKWISVTSRYIL